MEGDSLDGASESENRLGRRVAVRIERSFQPRSIVVEVRRSAGPRERVREALVDVARGHDGDVASGLHVELVEEKLDVVRHGIAQKVENPADALVGEAEGCYSAPVP